MKSVKAQGLQKQIKGKPMLLLNSVVCNSKKSRFIQERSERVVKQYVWQNFDNWSTIDIITEKNCCYINVFIKKYYPIVWSVTKIHKIKTQKL